MMRSRLKKGIASCLSAALFLTTPGFPVTSAMARMLKTAPRALGGASLGPAGVGLKTTAPSLTPITPTLTILPTLTTLPNLSALPTQSVPARAASVSSQQQPRAVAAETTAAPTLFSAVQNGKAEALPTPKELRRLSVAGAKTQLDRLWSGDQRSNPGTPIAVGKTLFHAHRHSGLDPVKAADSSRGNKSENRVAASTPVRSHLRKFISSPLLPAAVFTFFSGLELLLHGTHSLLPVVAFFCGVCVTFQTLEATEGGQKGFNTQELRREGMRELSSILRGFGREVEKESKGPDFKTQVSAELVARTGQKSMAYVMDAFLASLRENPPEDDAAAVSRFEEISRESLVRALQATGLSADSEKTIRAIIEKTGLLKDIVGWQEKHKFVSTLVEAVNKEEKTVQKTGKKKAARTGLGKSFGSGGPTSLVLLIAATAAWSTFFGPAEPLAGLTMVAMMGMVRRTEEEKKPLEHRLAAMLSEEELEFLKGALHDMEIDASKPLIGRTAEVDKILDSLSKPEGLSRSVLLTGPSGVGKRAIVEHLAAGIGDGRYGGMEETVVMELDASRQIGGEIDKFAHMLLHTLSKTENRIILYIDDPKDLKDTSVQNDQYAFFRILRPAMARGDITLLVSAKAKDAEVLAREGDFAENVSLEQPSEEDAEYMAGAHLEGIEDLFELSAEPGILKTAVRLSARYLNDLSLPGSVLALLEKAFTARTPVAEKNRRTSLWMQLSQRLLQNVNRYQKISQEDSTGNERLDLLYNQIVPDVEQLMRLKEDASSSEREALSANDLARTVSELTGIPTSRVLKDEKAKLLTLEDDLRKRVVHQDPAVVAVSQAVRRARAGLKDPNKPIGSFLFVGPTGVGKTELAKGLAELLFDDEEALIRIDMSEYKEPHSVARLSGTHPGYVGFEDGGQLTEAVKKRPYSVVLLDEVEKAHPEVLDLLLQVMDDGRLTDGHGDTVDFSNVIVIMTSNLGSNHIQDALESDGDTALMREKVLGAVKGHFRPEFVNRLTDIVQFNALDNEAAQDITGLHLTNKVDKWMRSRDEGMASLALPVAQNALALLVERGFDRVYGGRSLERVVRKLILDPLASVLIKKEAETEGRELKIHLSRSGDQLEFDIEALPLKSVERLELADAEARDLLDGLLSRQSPLTMEELEIWLFGDPESALSSEPLGIFHPMTRPLEGDNKAEERAASDNPDLKDPQQEVILKNWPQKMGLNPVAADAFSRWYTKSLRCAKSTNCKKVSTGENAEERRVQTRLVRTDKFYEIQIRGQALTRAELLETDRIFSDHFKLDSNSEDESWDFADELLNRGAYGRAELFEVKRHLNQVPGAEFGYWSDREQLVYWLRVPRTPDAGESLPEISKILSNDGDAQENASTLYHSLTKKDPRAVKRIRTLITRLLAAEDDTLVYLGFKAAHATMSAESYARLESQRPPLEFLQRKVAELYREDLGMSEPNPQTSEFSIEDRIKVIIEPGDTNERMDFARFIGAHPETVDSAIGKRVIKGLSTGPSRRIFTFKWLGRLKKVLGFGVVALAPYAILQWIWPAVFPALSWLLISPTSGWWHLVAIIGTLIGGLNIAFAANENFEDIEMESLKDYSHGFQLLGELSPIFDAAQKKRLHRLWIKFLRKQFHNRGRYSGQKQFLKVYYLKAAGALAAVAKDLTPAERSAAAKSLLANSGSGRTEILIAGYDLFSEAQRIQVNEILLKKTYWNNYGNSPRALLSGMTRLILEEKFPKEMNADLLERYMVLVYDDNVNAATYEAIRKLAEDKSTEYKLGLAESIWKVTEPRDEITVDLLETLLALSPGPRWAEKFVDSIATKENPAPSLATLDWLLKNHSDLLTPERRQAATEFLIENLRAATGKSGAIALGRDEISWDERFNILAEGFDNEEFNTDEFIKSLSKLHKEALSEENDAS
ncbi:MAG: hypothetical protein COB53_11770 [Elusimicrobia bacterium]|nr:MAG: hypothetical protein COB53_11770 [Elusimicrobiota bacterium]